MWPLSVIVTRRWSRHQGREQGALSRSPPERALRCLFQGANRMIQQFVQRPIGLRLIAAYKLAKALAVFALATAVFRLDPSAVAARVVRLAARLRLDPDSHLIHTWLARLSGLQPRQLEAVGAGLFLY